MTAADSSVLVAAFASWHELHRKALSVLGEGVRVPGHAALETYSVLTRLPPPDRVAGRHVVSYLTTSLARPFLVLSADALEEVIASLPGRGIRGGATYDALIAATAAANAATLVTFDARAAMTYRHFDVEVECLS